MGVKLSNLKVKVLGRAVDTRLKRNAQFVKCFG